MPQACKFCSSTRRRELEEQLALGMTQEEVSKRLGCRPSSVNRHVRNHMTPAILDAMKQDVEKASALNAVDALVEQYAIVKEWLQKAIEGGRVSEVAAMLKEGRKHIELSARLSGALGSEAGTQINMLNPEFTWLRDTVCNTLTHEDQLKLAEKLQAMKDIGSGSND